MIKIFAEDNEIFGPVVTDIKGLKKGAEWVMSEIQSALAYMPDGSLTVNWASTDLPGSLRRRLVVVYH